MNRLSKLRAVARERATQLEKELKRSAPGLSLALDVESLEGPERYSWLPDSVELNNKRLKRENSVDLPYYNKFILLHLLADFVETGGRYALPRSIVVLYERELERILFQTESFDDRYFDVGNDEFLKDLAIVTHRLIPVGAEFAEGGSGIPRRILFAAGARQFFRSLWFITFKCRGFKPYFALHAHTLALKDFHPEGWQATYHRLAELLELNPAMKGWLSASWFLDPALETISPHLAHLRKVPVENGGLLMFVRYERDGASGALVKSPTRRRLFAEGRYLPATYMRVWPREAVIDWSRRHANTWKSERAAGDQRADSAE